MDFDPSWLLISLPVAFVLGWLASRFDIRQLKLENRQAPKAYFRGLNFLLNEQQDQAIDAFIEAVQNDPDTQELHFALGNLFRRRGEYQRAVRVHEHLLGRGDLSRADRERAQHALAQDFLRAGLLDRAEAALPEARRARDTKTRRASRCSPFTSARANGPRPPTWRRSSTNPDQASYATRRAHHLCEQATESVAAGELPAAAKLLAQAVELAPQSTSPGHRHRQPAAAQRRCGRSLRHARGTERHRSARAAAVCRRTPSRRRVAAHREAEALALLQRRYAESPSIDVLEALIALGGTPSATAAARRATAARPARRLHRPPRAPALAGRRVSRWLAGEKFRARAVPSAKCSARSTRPPAR